MQLRGGSNQIYIELWVSLFSYIGMSKKVIIAGGSGMIGRALTSHLIEKGHQVEWLSHSDSEGPVKVHSWNPSKDEIPAEVLRSAEVIVNLAGAGIADKRWTDSRKNVIRASRVDGNQAIAQVLDQNKGNVKAFISSAAMGIYGDRGSTWCKESDTIKGDDFLIQICKDWESSIQQVESTGVRTAYFRISVVLSLEGGALPKIVAPMKFGIASYFGDGKQYYSWIHIHDLVRIFAQTIESENMSGVYNAASDQPLQMKEWMQRLVESSSFSPIIIPAPKFGLRLALGEMADVLLNSVRLDVGKLKETGFEWKFPTISDVGQDLLSDN